MKNTLLLLLAIGFSGAAYAQTPGWLWAETQTGGTCYTQAQQLVISKTGYIYISGRFAGTMTLGGVNVTSTGTEVFSGKCDNAGNFIWVAKHPASGGIDYSYGFGIDHNSNTYSTGTIGGSFFIDRYDSSGNQKWYKTGGNAAGYDIKADDSDNIYVTGEYAGTFTIGTQSVTSIGNSTDMFLAKLDSSGNCKWMVSAGGTGYDGGREIGIDGQGNIYVCGSYSANGIFGSVTAPTATSGYPSLFIAKYNSSGTALRVSTATNAGFDNSYQFWRWEVMTVDSCGNAFVGGNFINTAVFGSLSVTDLANSSGDLHNLYIAKLHSDGNWEWLQGGLGTGDDQSIGIALDRADNVYLTGDIEGTVQFGSLSATATSASGSAFITKYDNSTGDALWVQSNTGTGNWNFEGIAVDTNGYVYADGSGGNGTGIFGSSTTTDQASCGQNILIAKLDTIAPRAILPVLANSYCPGSTDTIPYTLLGSFNSGNEFIVELSDSTGNFISYDTLGSVTSNANGKIVITVPGGVTPGSGYLIRVVSTNPSASSYAACTGDIIDNVYNNSFFITIGGNISVSVTPTDTNICSGASVKLAATGGTSYLWSNNDTTGTITVTPTADTTTYSVTVINGGCVGTDSIRVTVAPVAPLIIEPTSTSICPGTGIVLTVSTSGSDYTWSPSTTLSTTTGDTVTAKPTVQTIYTASGLDSVGCTVSGSDTISISQAPNKPTITQDGDTLISSATQGNQWQRNDTVINGATNQTYIAITKGYYQVTASNPANGCSTTSDSASATGINQLTVESGQVTVYPNPTGGEFTLNISASAMDVSDWNLQIIDVLGRTVYFKQSLNYNNTIDLSDLSGGVYFICVINKTGKVVVPVVKQ